MTDPTLATVDNEPWNQFPTRQTPKERQKAFAERAPILNDQPVQRETGLSVVERIRKRIPFMTPKGHAEYVYDAHGHSTSPECCWHCEAKCILTCWTEFEYAPKDPVAKKHRREYIASADLCLCNKCSNKLRGLPLGERFPKTQGARLSP